MKHELGRHILSYDRHGAKIRKGHIIIYIAIGYVANPFRQVTIMHINL